MQKNRGGTRARALALASIAGALLAMVPESSRALEPLAGSGPESAVGPVSGNGSAPPLTAGRISKFVEIEPGRSLYFDYILPQPGRETIVLWNGLTYRTGPGCWEKLAAELRAKGLGVFMWDPVGMGQTLLRDGVPDAAISIFDGVRDAAKLFDVMGFNEPLNLAGLSYGGGASLIFAATYPQRIKKLILMSPAVGPLAQQEHTIDMQIAATRALFPFNTASNSTLHDYFLKALIYATYPFVEPIVLENPYKLEAIFRLAQGAISYQSADFVGRLPPASTFLVIADKDQYIPTTEHDTLWSRIPSSAQMARIYVEGSEHKLSEAEPKFMGKLLDLIVEGDSRLAGGRSFTGNPSLLELRSLQGASEPRLPMSIRPAIFQNTCSSFISGM